MPGHDLPTRRPRSAYEQTRSAAKKTSDALGQSQDAYKQAEQAYRETKEQLTKIQSSIFGKMLPLVPPGKPVIPGLKSVWFLAVSNPIDYLRLPSSFV